LKLAGFYAEFERAKLRLIAAQREVATCAISGAVGTFANIDPAVEEYVAEKMGLSPEPVSTQVIPRDRHAMFFATLGVVASSVERLATELRHLQRTEVLEAKSSFPKAKRLFGDAAQAQPGSDRESDRPRPHGAGLCAAGA
jgi:adenylosuccinate lyase